MDKERKKLFICGCPRSGTSAFCDWIVHSGKFALGMERYQAHWMTHFNFPANAFTKKRFFGIEPGDTWYTDLESFPTHYARAAEIWDDAIFTGDKIPGLWRNLSGLIKRFPESKIIYMYREPFAVARSYKQRAAVSSDTNWGKRRDVQFAVAEWNESISKVLEFINSPVPRAKDGSVQCLIMSYEQFVSNAFDRRSLAEFLGPACPPPSAAPAYNRSTQKMDIPVVELTNIERDLVWSSVDHHAANELRKTVRSQSLSLKKKAAKSQLPGRREWYHTEDKKLAHIDYGENIILGCNYVFRGRNRPIATDEKFVACVGSATTFGRFIKMPFAVQLEIILKLPVLNLGIGGARIEQFLTNDALLKTLNQACHVIFELTSARSYPSPIFSPRNIDAAFGYFIDYFGLKNINTRDKKLCWLISTIDKNQPVFVDHVYEIVFPYLDGAQRDLIRDSLVTHYIRDLDSLIAEIKSEKTFLLMTRTGPYAARSNRNPHNFDEWSGSYPHFVDKTITDILRGKGCTVIESRSTRGFPYTVTDRLTGAPAKIFNWQDRPELNKYYPSQEMHDDAAALLAQHLLSITYV